MSRYFWLIFAPSSPCHTSSHIPGPPPESTSHISDPPPIFRRPSTKNPDKSPLVQILSQLFTGVFVRGVLSVGLLSGRFCPGWFLSVPVLSEYICYIRKLNITLNFMFRVYDKKYKCDVTCSLPPPPVTNCHTFLDPPNPLERDVLYGRPPMFYKLLTFITMAGLEAPPSRFLEGALCKKFSKIEKKEKPVLQHNTVGI